MDSEDDISSIVARMAAAPEDSEEFWTALDELRAALKASSNNARRQIGAAIRRFHSASN